VADTDIPQRDRHRFVVLAGLVFIYVVLRALLVPLTHDEARTFFVYTLSGEYLPWLSHWDAGNHLLCTALGRASYTTFGMAPFALRLFNVLSFAVYAMYVWRSGAWVRDTFVRWSLWGALLMAPVLIEFFAMYRGYGMAMAFLLMGLFHTVEAVRGGSARHLFSALLAWLLANAAMLSLMILWCSALLALFHAVMAARVRPVVRIAMLVPWLILGVLPAIGAAVYGSELGARGLLYYGSSDGLLHGSLLSVAMMLFGEGGDWTMWPLLAVSLAALLFAGTFVFKDRREFKWTPLTILSLFFVMELLGRLVLGELRGVLYPIGRSALHWLPIVVFMVALVADRMALRWASWRYAALVLAVFPLRTMVTANLTHTSLWPEEAISSNILDMAASKQREAARPLLIGAYSQMPPQWDYARLRNHPTLAPVSSSGFPRSACDLLLLDTTFFRTPPGYVTIATSTSGRQVLKERMEPLRLTEVRDSVLTPRLMDDEFTTLAEPRVQDVLGMVLVLDLELVLRADAECLMTELVVEVDGAAGEHQHYEALQLRYLQQAWTGDTLHLLRRVPMVTRDTERVVCYLWNKGGQRVSLEHARLRILQMQPYQDFPRP